jgi:hypothetical protein
MDQKIRLFSGAGGGALMSMIQNCFRGRSRAPAGGGGDDYPADNRGGYIPPRPVAEEGKGLYPSKEVKDEGAGKRTLNRIKKQSSF